MSNQSWPSFGPKIIWSVSLGKEFRGHSYAECHLKGRMVRSREARPVVLLVPWIPCTGWGMQLKNDWSWYFEVQSSRQGCYLSISKGNTGMGHILFVFGFPGMLLKNANS